MGSGSDQAQTQAQGCNTSLSLDLRGFNNINSNTTKKLEKPSSSISALRFDHVFPGLSLGLVADQGLSISPGSSSYSNYSSSVKRSLDQDRDFGGFHGDEVDKGSSRTSEEEEEEDEASPRKKLRLTKEQSAVLEDSFKEHSTLNPQQKQALAKRLNLRPRQVEVWFQNRRARTKLKQTEMDCEVLKKCCETLSEENKRLQKELHELKSLKLSSTPSVYMQMPSPTLSMCPSCERFISTATSPVNGHHLTTTPQGGAKPPQTFFTHHSAAC